MAADETSLNRVLSQLFAIAERLHPVALMLALVLAMISWATLDHFGFAPEAMAALDKIFSGGALTTLFLIFAVPLSLLDGVWQARRVARRAEQARIDEERRSLAKAQADTEQRKAAYAACTKAEKEVLAVFIARSCRTLNLYILISSVTGANWRIAGAPNEVVVAAAAAEAAIDALVSRRFLHGPADREQHYTLENPYFDELVADPSLIGLTTPGRPPLPRTRE